MLRNTYNKLKLVSVLDKASSERLLVKATEEIGELAEAINWSTGYKHTEKTKKEIKDAICEEGIDNIICVLAIFEKEGLTDGEIHQMFKKKLEKYRSKVDKNKK